MCLVRQVRGIRRREPLERGMARTLGGPQVAALQLEARQQQVARHGPARYRCARETNQRAATEDSSADVLSGAIEHERLIEVEQPEPHVVAFPGEQPAGATQQFPPASVVLPARRQREVRQRLGCFVGRPERIESGQGPRGEFTRFVAQVQLQVHFRAVEIAERAVITVPDQLAAFARGPVQLERPRCTHRGDSGGRRRCNRPGRRGAASRAVRNRSARRGRSPAPCRSRSG